MAATDIVQIKAKTLQALLEVSKKQIEAALPRHMTPDRLLRIAMTEARKNPALLDCTQASFLGAIIQTAQLGLEPGGALGHSYLVPFKNKRNNTLEVQLIVGYRGMINLAYRAPQVSHIMARAVYDGDKFEYRYGLEEKLDHLPDPEANGKELTHVYAIVWLKGGGKIFDVMERKEVEGARSRSKSADSGPWETDYEAMAKKSVVRRLFKYMPASIEMQEAIGLDEAGDRGEQSNGLFFETTGTVVQEPSKTDKFKEHMGAAETKESPTELAQEAPAAGSFADFAQTNPFSIEQPIKTKQELVNDVFAAAEAAGLDLPGIEKSCVKYFKKKPQELDHAQLVELVELINKTKAAKGKS